MLSNDPPSEQEIFLNKRPDTTYLSGRFDTKAWIKTDLKDVVDVQRPLRYLSKVIDCSEDHQFIKSGKEICLRITEGSRQEIKAKFYEDTRGIITLQIQRYSSSGNPHNCSFTFVGEEINKLYNFIQHIPLFPINGAEKQKVRDHALEQMTDERAQMISMITNQPGMLVEILKNEITQEDIISLGYRKQQLSIFKELLESPKYFEEHKSKLGLKSDEATWQNFFEMNAWIFGYGLNYIFNTPLGEKKLEQTVAGYTTFSAGKRVDALMQTKGLISSLCFAEIKTPTASLLDNRPYRTESYRISGELTGGISQLQKTVHKALQQIKSKTEIKDDNGNLTGDSVFLYQPKSVLIIGSLAEFVNEFGVNEDRFSSFELFRRNITNPDIITFDELYERTRHIVESLENN